MIFLYNLKVKQGRRWNLWRTLPSISEENLFNSLALRGIVIFASASPDAETGAGGRDQGDKMKEIIRTMAQLAMERTVVVCNGRSPFWDSLVAGDGEDNYGYSRFASEIIEDEDWTLVEFPKNARLALYDDGSILVCWDEDGTVKLAAKFAKIGMVVGSYRGEEYNAKDLVWNGIGWETKYI